MLLKPAFGSLPNRIGGKPVLLGGLSSFAAASALSPSASALVARLNPAAKRGRAFSSYGFYKSIGYTLGGILVLQAHAAAAEGMCVRPLGADRQWAWECPGGDRRGRPGPDRSS
ncbi:hypothetical protein GCM10009837_19940 [Streptomyces durmitorensis]|uniref:MFS transporter n=1 Tax=Streptomyces durmitorensis TaxID=319947 RepID=A0ABY4PQF0_9ACTN|nr:hypothetical protein [Streptomyces durmitorensis]UQT55347.1 hypothetical protein M4V62_09685 [Streptomyces durmitorensis]